VQISGAGSDFYLPKRTVIASVQGIRNHKATEGTLGSMKAHNSRAPEVDLLQDGHILRWTKQMALRGNGRQHDENGICGHQKLVCSGDRKKFLTYAQVLFPGAIQACFPWEVPQEAHGTPCGGTKSG
jgi:hypothetical protein